MPDKHWTLLPFYLNFVRPVDLRYIISKEPSDNCKHWGTLKANMLVLHSSQKPV